MSEAIALEPLPEALSAVLVDHVKLCKLIRSQAHAWLATQSEGPDKRRFKAAIDVMHRDALVLEQYLVRELGRSA